MENYKTPTEIISNQDHEEELWCVHEYLNKLCVPQSKNGFELSIVGRVMAYQKMTHDDAYNQINK